MVDNRVYVDTEFFN